MGLLKVGESHGVEFYEANVTFQSLMARRAPIEIGPYESSLNATGADFTSRHSKRSMKRT